ncbi:DUF1772 domain-containing protein [Mesorhizobium sp. B2-3-5]|uniref:DUF1772 domain-containing protein n=1 Tax=Mesorhizobium sp. B2-3-5 TaxID=2589958 RepID=UPI00112AD4E8|nr:DUF1772 domain-containing protein [Mesorhizobium sp. B2-3-5]TPM32653.1 DUF1772 domain-containing protein [Mesorhizobium sp. B2-3-5]
MYVLLEVVTVILVASAMAMALAHALELPGKLRLGKERYFVVQQIYYPGFTIGGGVAEVGGIIATLASLLTARVGSIQFWLIACALAALLVMQGIFWFMTQPVNKCWLQGVELSSPAKGFFGTEGRGRPAQSQETEWIALRNRWEISHVMRAVAAMLSLALLTTAIALHDV